MQLYIILLYRHCPWLFLSADRRYDVVILSTITSELNMHSVKAINSGETIIGKKGLETLGDPNRLCAGIANSRQGLIILG